MNIRIIARLDIKGPYLVKGIHLEGLRVLGYPENYAQHYYDAGADEIYYQDAVASLYNRNSLPDLVTTTAKKIFIPLTVGGGLRSIDDIRSVLRAGADKVSLNTAAIKSPDLIREASRQFGSSTIVVAIEAIKQADGRYMAYTDNGREYAGIEVISWAKQVAELGAGEIALTSVDREGTGLGFDLDLVRAVSDSVAIPVIAHGGAGKLDHIEAVISSGHAQAVALASMIHYDFLKSDKAIPVMENEFNLEFRRTGRSYSKVEPVGLEMIKNHLVARGIPCRHNLHQKSPHD